MNQRLPRYQLLLKTIHNKTPADHPDYEPLQEAVKQIASINRHLNEQLGEADNRAFMVKTQKRFTAESPYYSKVSLSSENP